MVVDTLGSILESAKGITTAISGIAAVAGLYTYIVVIPRREASLRAGLIGQGVVNPDLMVKVLRQFKADKERLAALQSMLKYDGKTSEDVLEKIKKFDPTVSQIESGKRRAKTLLGSGGTLLAFAVLITAVPPPASISPVSGGGSSEIAIGGSGGSGDELLVENAGREAIATNSTDAGPKTTTRMDARYWMPAALPTDGRLHRLGGVIVRRDGEPLYQAELTLSCYVQGRQETFRAVSTFDGEFSITSVGRCVVESVNGSRRFRVLSSGSGDHDFILQVTN